MRRMLLPLMTELMLCLNTQGFSREEYVHPCKRYRSLDDAGISVRKMQHCLVTKWNFLSIKSVLSSSSDLLSRHATQKQTPPYRLSMAQPVKFEFHSSLTSFMYIYIYIHWPNTIFHSKKRLYCSIILPTDTYTKIKY